MKLKLVPAILALGLLAALAACTTAPTKVTVAVTSHSDGQRIVGSRTVTLSGTLAGGPVTALTIELNGATVSGATQTASTFSVPLTLDDGNNAVVVSATSGAGTTSESLTLVYPHLTFSTFQPADVVIGQPDFTSSGDNLTQSGLGGVYGNPALIGGVLYVPDYGQERVLGFADGIPSSNGANASFVLGQPDFASDATGTAADEMDGPQTVVAADGRMFVADYGNNRVLIYDTPPTATQAAADLVVGQTDFGSNAQDCSATGMYEVESVFAIGSKLIVGDSGNNRVLIYDTAPTANGAAADLVLGQGTFDTCTANDDNQDGTEDAGPSARTMTYPTDIWSDGTRLVVADSDNNRVLIWNTFPTSNFQPADVVVGQPDMTSNGSAAGPDGMYYPYFLASNGNQLFVADSDNNRVLVFEGIPTSNGASADTVLGQGDFVHVTTNDDNQDGTDDGAPTARTFSFPDGLLVTDEALIVGDNDNSRMLVFGP